MDLESAIDFGVLPLGNVADGGTGDDTVVIHFQGVTNLATDQPVRVLAEFSTGSWAVVVDGINGPSLSNFEHLQIDAGDAADRIIGGQNADTISGAGGNDILRGGGGNDEISKSRGVYNVQGGTGFDTLNVALTNTKNPGAALIFDAVAGTIAAGAATSGSFGGFERYQVLETIHDDTVTLGDAADRGIGGDGTDTITLGGGNDFGDGGTGADTIYGGAGQDELHSGNVFAGNAREADQLFGGAGDDHLIVETPGSGTVLTFAGAVFNGGGGNDFPDITGSLATVDLTWAAISGIKRIDYLTTFSFSLQMTAAQVNAISTYNVGRLEVKTAGDLEMAGELNINSITLFSGGQKIDLSASTRLVGDFGPQVIGGAGADVITGSVRRDSFAGLDGADELIGGAGNDVPTGGAGADLLYGGADQDTFTYNFVTESGAGAANRGVIFDFQVAPGNTASFVDRLNLAFIDASVTGASDQGFAFIGAQGFTAEGQLRATRMNAIDTLIEMNSSGTSGAEMQIVLKNFMATDFTASDYLA